MFLIRNTPHIYDLPLDLCKKRIEAPFATIRRMLRIFTAKSTTVLELRRFTRRCTVARPSKCGALQDGALRRGHQNAALYKTVHCGAAIKMRRFTRRCTAARPSKCGAHGGRKVAHMAPCFQVTLRHACCIIFDVYHKYCFVGTCIIYTVKNNYCATPLHVCL